MNVYFITLQQLFKMVENAYLHNLQEDNLDTCILAIVEDCWLLIRLIYTRATHAISSRRVVRILVAIIVTILMIYLFPVPPVGIGIKELAKPDIKFIGIDELKVHYIEKTAKNMYSCCCIDSGQVYSLKREVSITYLDTTG